MKIRAVQPEDLPAIVALERRLEGESAAELQTLRVRQRMFPAGFLAAWKEENLLGYIETCQWGKQIPEFDADPEFFRRFHQERAAILYVIFIGVQPWAQRQGVGRRLLAAAQGLAVSQAAQRVHAVARRGMARFYLGAGFQLRRPLPEFWGGGDFHLMEWRVAENSNGG